MTLRLELVFTMCLEMELFYFLVITEPCSFGVSLFSIRLKFQGICIYCLNWMFLTKKYVNFIDKVFLEFELQGNINMFASRHVRFCIIFLFVRVFTFTISE